MTHLTFSGLSWARKWNWSWNWTARAIWRWKWKQKELRISGQRFQIPSIPVQKAYAKEIMRHNFSIVLPKHEQLFYSFFYSQFIFIQQFNPLFYLVLIFNASFRPSRDAELFILQSAFIIDYIINQVATSVQCQLLLVMRWFFDDIIILMITWTTQKWPHTNQTREGR